MTPDLQRIIDEVVSHEHLMNIIEIEHMAMDQMSGYPGFKRQHRYLSRWRNETAIRLINFVIDHYAYRPKTMLSFESKIAPDYNEGIREIIGNYEALRLLYVKLSRVALNESHDELNQFAQKAICWISKTKMMYLRDFVETESKTNEYKQLRSERLHEKYKNKESEFKV
jgi:hypothetical protein